MNIEELEPGMILKKGQRKRIYIGIQGLFVYYKTPSSPNSTTGELIFNFKRWLEDAEVVPEEVDNYDNN